MIPPSMMFAVGKGVTSNAALVMFGRLWKWAKGEGYAKAKKVALREMLKGDKCNWTLVESAIAEGRVRQDTSADAIRLDTGYHTAKRAPQKKAAARKGGSKKKAAKRKPAKKNAAKKKAAKKK